MREKSTEKLEVTLRENLLHIRLLREMTQGMVAKQLGVRINFMSRIENGERTISAACVYKLCKIYDVSLDDIYSDTFQERNPLSKPQQDRVRKSSKPSMEDIGATKRSSLSKKQLLKL